MAPDASWAVVVAGDGSVRTWRTGAAQGVARGAVTIEAGQPAAVALAGNCLRILWAAEEMIRLHETVDGAEPREKVFPVPARVRALALSPSGRLAVVACDDGTLRSLDPGTGESGQTLATGALTARAVAVASDQGPVVAAFPDGTVRRFDLATGASDLVGTGHSVHFLAVTPDGGTVIATGTDGIVFRWRPPPGSPPDVRALGTALTAIAADATGDKVLAGTATGRLWLHDLTGGPAVEFGVTGTDDQPAFSAPGPDLLAPKDRTERELSSMIDNDVRFSVYRPQALSAGVWASLLVFAHKTDLVIQPGRAPVDPTEQVEAMARAHFGDTPVRSAGEDARGGVSRGARLRITVDLPHLICNPAEAEFDWWEPVHQVVFRLLAGPDLIDSVVRGAVRVWCGLLLLGEVSLAIRVTASPPVTQSPTVTDSARRYRRIFPSYSHDDGAVVDDFAEAARAIGDQFLQDVLALRSGERWRARLPELIEEADVFQLFWSRNSMRSPYCREEWEYALALGRPLFVRPLYWEDPMPQDPAMGLPPAALRELEFVKVRLHPTRSGMPAGPGAEQPEIRTPAPATAAPAAPSGESAPSAQPASGSGPPRPTPVPSRTPSDRTAGAKGKPRPARPWGKRVFMAVPVVVLFLAVGTVALAGLLRGSRPPASARPTTSASQTLASPTQSPGPGVTPLIRLLPQDIDDPVVQCRAAHGPYQWDMPGLVTALSCRAPGLPDGSVFGYQTASSAGFEAAWRNFNTWWGFSRSTAQARCPPAGGRHGIVGFRSESFPPRPGQVLECTTVTGPNGAGTAPAYAWALPSQNAFFIAVGADGSSFSELDSWWKTNAIPVISPSPSGR
jgi:TIR domain/WD domain, G-beta repeat